MLAGRKIFFLLYPALIAAIFIPSLLDLGYWPLDAEVLLLGGATILLALLLACVATRVRLVNFLLLSIFLYWLLDAYFFDRTWLAALGGVLCFCFLLSKFQQNIVSMLLTFSVVWVALALLQPVKQYLDQPLSPISASKRPNLPPIVHLILDEQMSPTLADSTVTQALNTHTMIDEYVANGFHVMSRAESVSSETQLSLSDLFALQKEAPKTNVKIGSNGFTYTVAHNHYFDTLKKAGYQIIAVQSSFLQMCKPSAETFCAMYSRTGHGHSMTRFSGRLHDRLRSAILELHYRFYDKKTVANVGLYRKISKAIYQIFAIQPKQKSVFYTRPVAVLNILDDVERILQTPQQGTAYVFHLLLPHFPYVLDEHCQLKSADDWQVPYRHSHVAIDQSKIYRGYWQQTQCVHQRVLTIVKHLDENNKQAIVIVHGDHGARIARDKNESSLEAKADTLQTFLAVKSTQNPYFPAKETSSLVTLQDAFADTVLHLWQ